MQEILNQVYFGNSLFDYLYAVGSFIAGMFIIWIIKKFVINRLKKWAEKTETIFDDLLVRLIERSLLPLVYFGLFYLIINTLKLSPSFKKGLDIAATIFVVLFVIKLAISIANFILQSYTNKSSAAGKGEPQLKGVKGLINLVIWSLGLLFMLDNLGVQISAVIAGLGIGGIAVALAAQAVLGDLFSYFVIFFDKPFEIGDFIIVGDKLGVVEYVGIKTTRIRALGGEQLVFSNTDLTNSRVHNFKKMERRRVVFKLGVIYQTSAEKLKKIPQIVKDIITNQQDADFDRGHFASFGNFSLDFEFVYYVTGADYNKYMDIQQAINLSIYEAFEKEGIEFAYPTQTLFLNKENGYEKQEAA